MDFIFHRHGIGNTLAWNFKCTGMEMWTDRRAADDSCGRRNERMVNDDVLNRFTDRQN